ncbi:hypothetical protein B0T26DRAFT_739523 [Lasiosphaeria miniovina]|uniref:Uncharacterized protein n=1 Tax=Lasiosphaeria miniovina TaxID=1954250 RepID=A0AA40AUH8_9PEZI|nr:uncharacterized protein B0T26DRAFT_739523 [Lasiosphaeria miniovina]KAK0722252.1 hypothetical protein B0T26DRAFT_739523 [Lasiosphaeria miniovina]
MAPKVQQRSPAPAPAPAPAPEPATSPKQQQQQARDDESAAASRTLELVARQQPTVATIPSFYGSLYDGPDPGTVAGITLGSVGGFILLLWLIYTCINVGNTSAETTAESSVGTASVVTRKRHRHSHRSSRGPVAETVEIRRTASRGGGPVIVEEVVTGGGGGERIVVEERRRSVSRPRIIHSDDDDDEVVVIEEHSPPPRRRSRIRSVERRSTYREVDPDRFAGGDSPVIEVRRSTSRRR